jgi:hypothetical protein
MAKLRARQTFERDIKKVLNNLNKEVKKVEGRTLQGLLVAAAQIKKTSQDRTPREYSILWNSAYVRKGKSNPITVQIGYSASYAVFVHEKVKMKLRGKPRRGRKGRPPLGVYWGPSGRAKFLESSVVDLTQWTVKVVAKYASIQTQGGGGYEVPGA